MTIRVPCFFLCLLFGSAVVPGLTGEALLARLDDALSDIADYQVRVASWVEEDGQTERRIINLYFRRPDHLRLDVIHGSGFGDTGSVAVVADGEVRVKPGLGFIRFALTYGKDHRRVTSIRGRSADMAHILVIRDQMARGVDEGLAKAFEIEEHYVYEAERTLGGVPFVERVFLDRESLLPVHYESFEDGRLAEYVLWLHYLLNQGLPSEIFSVDYPADRLEELPMLTLAAWEIGEAEQSALEPGPVWGRDGP